MSREVMLCLMGAEVMSVFSSPGQQAARVGFRRRRRKLAYSTCPSVCRARTQPCPSTTCVTLRSNTSWVRRGIDDCPRGLFPLGRLCSMVSLCLVRAGAVIVSVVAGGCPGVTAAGLSVKQLLPGVDAVAMTTSLVLPIEEGIDLSSWISGVDNDASPADEVTGWVASGVVVDRTIWGVAFVSRVEVVGERAGPIAVDA